MPGTACLHTAKHHPPNGQHHDQLHSEYPPSSARPPEVPPGLELPLPIGEHRGGGHHQHRPLAPLIGVVWRELGLQKVGRRLWGLDQLQGLQRGGGGGGGGGGVEGKAGQPEDCGGSMSSGAAQRAGGRPTGGGGESRGGGIACMCARVRRTRTAGQQHHQRQQSGSSQPSNARAPPAPHTCSSGWLWSSWPPVLPSTAAMKPMA